MFLQGKKAIVELCCTIHSEIHVPSIGSMLVFTLLCMLLHVNWSAVKVTVYSCLFQQEGYDTMVGERGERLLEAAYCHCQVDPSYSL